jgi:hypothetical protein
MAAGRFDGLLEAATKPAGRTAEPRRPRRRPPLATRPESHPPEQNQQPVRCPPYAASDVSSDQRGVMLYGHGVEAVAEALRELDPRYVLIDRGVTEAGRVPVLRFRHAAEVDAAREAAPGVAWLAVELYQPGGYLKHARQPLLWLNASKSLLVKGVGRVADLVGCG